MSRPTWHKFDRLFSKKFDEVFTDKLCAQASGLGSKHTPGCDLTMRLRAWAWQGASRGGDILDVDGFPGQGTVILPHLKGTHSQISLGLNKREKRLYETSDHVHERYLGSGRTSFLRCLVNLSHNLSTVLQREWRGEGMISQEMMGRRVVRIPFFLWKCCGTSALGAPGHKFRPSSEPGTF
ncbi:hypothetical protein Tco_1149691 [Tanacetum coccineum]